MRVKYFVFGSIPDVHVTVFLSNSITDLPLIQLPSSTKMLSTR